MVYTRSSNEVSQAARTLLSLRSSLPRTSRVTVTVTEGPSDTQLWSNWTTWYHAFASELQDELGSSRQSKTVTEGAEARWATFCAKKLRCDLTYVQSWLQATDAKERYTAAF